MRYLINNLEEIIKNWSLYLSSSAIGAIGAGLSYAALKIFKKPPMIYSFADAKSVQIGVKIRYGTKNEKNAPGD